MQSLNRGKFSGLANSEKTASCGTVDRDARFDVDAAARIAKTEHPLQLHVGQCPHKKSKTGRSREDRARRAPREAIGHQTAARGSGNDADGRRPFVLHQFERFAVPGRSSVLSGSVFRVGTNIEPVFDFFDAPHRLHRGNEIVLFPIEHRTAQRDAAVGGIDLDVRRMGDAPPNPRLQPLDQHVVRRFVAHQRPKAGEGAKNPVPPIPSGRIRGFARLDRAMNNSISDARPSTFSHRAVKEIHQTYADPGAGQKRCHSAQ